MATAKQVFAALPNVMEVWITPDGNHHLDSANGGERFERKPTKDVLDELDAEIEAEAAKKAADELAEQMEAEKQAKQAEAEAAKKAADTKHKK